MGSIFSGWHLAFDPVSSLISPIGGGWDENKINRVFDPSHVSLICLIMLFGKEPLEVNFLPKFLALSYFQEHDYYIFIIINKDLVFLVAALRRSVFTYYGRFEKEEYPGRNWMLFLC